MAFSFSCQNFSDRNDSFSLGRTRLLPACPWTRCDTAAELRRLGSLQLRHSGGRAEKLSALLWTPLLIPESGSLEWVGSELEPLCSVEVAFSSFSRSKGGQTHTCPSWHSAVCHTGSERLGFYSSSISPFRVTSARKREKASPQQHLATLCLAHSVQREMLLAWPHLPIPSWKRSRLQAARTFFSVV